MKKIHGKQFIREIKIPKHEEDAVEIHPLLLEEKEEIIIDVSDCNIYDYVTIINYLSVIKTNVLVLVEYEGKIIFFKDWYC